jgi:HSP20 family protein
MSVRDLIPWGKGSSQTPTVYRDFEQNPFLSLHREVNRLFDDVFRGFEMPSGFGRSGMSIGWPNVELSDADKELRISAELPGLEERDVEVVLEDGVLTLRGEKKSETEDKDRQFSERVYGRFERRIAVGSEIEQDKVKAAFKNGILTVTLPKTEKARSNAKRIAINGG